MNFTGQLKTDNKKKAMPFNTDTLDILTGDDSLKMEHVVIIEKESIINLATAFIIGLVAFSLLGRLFRGKK